MKLSQVKGNTWVAEGRELIPFYKLDEHRCILLDTGLYSEREELERSLLDNGLTPAGILCSHAHVDHCANNAYLQQKYHIPVALTPQEAAMCQNLLTLKCYFMVFSIGQLDLEASCMIHTPDVLVPPEDGPFDFAGARFRIIHTPGHSPGHISTITPDNVCYVADALLSHDLLGAKLPYNLCHRQAMGIRKKLRGLGCDAYIMAHTGVCPPVHFEELIDANQQLLQERLEEILEVIDRPMSFSEIAAAVCKRYQLYTHKARRAHQFERNIQFFVEYLVDTGLVEMESRRGALYYRPARQQPPADCIFPSAVLK